jgi:hypothetical protein
LFLRIYCPIFKNVGGMPSFWMCFSAMDSAFYSANSFAASLKCANSIGKASSWFTKKYNLFRYLRNIRTIRGKLKRVVMQFTPESWMSVNWLQGSDVDIHHSNWASTWAGLKRCFAIYAFIMVWLVSSFNK